MILKAPNSTKGIEKARDCEMHQTRRGKQCFFSTTMNIGVDTRTGLLPSAAVTVANVNYEYPLMDILRGAERRVDGDSAYVIQKARNKKTPRTR